LAEPSDSSFARQLGGDDWGEMERSASEPAAKSKPRRYKKIPTVRDPDSCLHGWASHPLASSGPRWTMGKQGLQSDTTQRSAKGGTHKDRDTWIQGLVREKTWVPGPGAYKTEREFKRKELDDEVDTNTTVQEAAPDWTFEKSVRETNVTMKDLKPRKNDGTYPTFEPRYVPGPGTYTAFTMFGCPSGGIRKSWAGEKSPKATHTFETLQTYPNRGNQRVSLEQIGRKKEHCISNLFPKIAQEEDAKKIPQKERNAEEAKLNRTKAE